MECKFCSEEVQKLEESHIISKFIYRWIKNTSITGRLRDIRNINLPVQDGLKVEFLCEKCETDFSVGEKVFSEDVFIPFVNSKGSLSLLNSINTTASKKFILSIVWRATKYCINDREFNGNFTSKEITKFNESIDELKEAYKSEGKSTLKIYIIPTTEEFYNDGILKFNDYAYFERSVSVDFRIYDDKDGRAASFIKIPYFLIVSEFKSHKKDNWTGLDLFGNLLFDSKKCCIPDYVNDYMEFDCQRAYEESDKMSDKQKQKIADIAEKKIADLKTKCIRKQGIFSNSYRFIYYTIKKKQRYSYIR